MRIFLRRSCFAPELPCRHRPLASKSRARTAGTATEAGRETSRRTANGRHRGVSDMTCREVRSYFENPLLVQITPPGGSGEVSQHVGECPDCKRFMETQKELAVSLRIAHQSAPEF